MVRQADIDKLHDMRLSSCMADAFESQYNGRAFALLSFKDRFSILTDK